MQLGIEALKKHLESTLLSPWYFISASEFCLLQEAVDNIRVAAGIQGINYFETVEVDQYFDWDLLKTRFRSLNLFYSRPLVQLRCQALSIEAGNKLIQLIQTGKAAATDPIYLVTYNYSTTKFKTTTWFKTLLQTAIVVVIEPISVLRLPYWLKTRLKAVKLDVTPDALTHLSTLVEGNISTGVQAIKKLQLLYSPSPEASKNLRVLNAEEVLAVIDNEAQFELFTWVEAVFQGKIERSLHILHYLKTTAFAPALLLWGLLREIRQLASLLNGLAQGKTLSQLFQIYQLGVKRQALFRAIIPTYTARDLFITFELASQVDRRIKGLAAGNVWEDLIQLSLQISTKLNKQLPSQKT
jgi:DNA polymerase III subunit delta